MYSEKNGSLIMRKKILLDRPASLLSHLFESHDNYMTQTAYSDAEYLLLKLEALLRTKFNNKNIVVSNLVEDTSTGEKYYPVNIKFTLPASDIAHDTDISLVGMRIPEINRKGLLNIRGRYLSCLNELNKAPDFNIDDKGNYQLKTLDSSLNFVKSKKSKYIISFKGMRGQLCTLAELAIYLACEAGELDKTSDTSQNVKEYIYKNYSGIAMRLMTEQIKNTFISTIYAKVSEAFGYIKWNELRLGGARKAINEYLSLNRIIGQTLAKSIGNFEKGTLVTPDIWEKIKYNKEEKIFIKYKPDLAGFYTDEKIGVMEIPAGTKVSPFLLEKLPELKGYGYLPNNIRTDVALERDIIIDNDINSFLNSLDMDTFCIRKSKSAKDSIKIPFMKEIVTNYDEKSETLTIKDLKALISYITGTVEIPELYMVYHRDSNFLKHAYTFSETLSNSYRDNVRRYISFSNAIEVKGAIAKAIQGRFGDFQKVMDKIIQKTFNALYTGSLYREPDLKNPAALLTHSRRLVSLVPDNGATISMRAVMMGHYGRICPFDTPQSAKIGLTNSMAVRTKIQDGEMVTPYHPIVKKNGAYYVSRRIDYLTPKKEFEYKIGDIMSLMNEDNQLSVYESPIINTFVQARVPSMGNTQEFQTIESVQVQELDYVNVFEDQILSHCASLIPFIGSNDGSRITFGCSMFRQAEAVMCSEKPYIYTGMYQWLINDSEYIVRAESDGVIKSITPNAITIQYDNKNEPVKIPLKRQTIKTGNIIIMEAHKTVGERVLAGELIADSLISRDAMFSPGVNFFVAFLPYYGYNNEDGIVITQNAANKLTSFAYNNASISLGEYMKNAWTFESYVKIGEYVNAGQDILCVKSKNTNVRNRHLSARFGKTGVIQKIGKSLDTRADKITFKADIITVEELDMGDKLSGRHGNKGVVTLIEQNSKAPSFLNGELIDIILNPCGLPSRMNLGQELEAHLSFVCFLLDLQIRSDSFNGAEVDEIKELLQFCYDVANAEEAEKVIYSHKYQHLPDIIKIHARERIEYIQNWKNCFFPDGTAYLINNRTGKRFANRVVIGNMYFMKLAHEVEHKRSERGGILDDTTYSATSKQPMRGLKRFGGQAIGEMEMWAILSHGANKLFSEMLHDKSDNKYIMRQMCQAVKQELPYEKGFNPLLNSNHGTEVFQYLLEGMNGYLETNVGTDLSLKGIKNANNIKDDNLTDIDFLQKYMLKEGTDENE